MDHLDECVFVHFKTRLVTFNRHSLPPFLDPYELAINGFYNVFNSTNIKCYFCKIEIMWKSGDVVYTTHNRWAPQCPLVRRKLPENCPEMLYQKYRTTEQRMDSFVNIKIHDIPAETFAEAGLYYEGSEDKVKCYLCQIGFYKFQKYDIPMHVHIQYSPQCPLVKKEIQKVTQDNLVVTNIHENDEKMVLASIENNIVKKKDRYDNICIICCENKVKSCYLPCAHAITCMSCAQKTTTCPMCRAQFYCIIELYFN